MAQCGCGGEPVRKDRKKTIAARFGKVCFGRRPATAPASGILVPRDGALGVAGESYSPGLLRVTALFNAEPEFL